MYSHLLILVTAKKIVNIYTTFTASLLAFRCSSSGSVLGTTPQRPGFDYAHGKIFITVFLIFLQFIFYCDIRII